MVKLDCLASTGALPFTSSMILDKLLDLDASVFSICKMGLIIVSRL